MQVGISCFEALVKGLTGLLEELWELEGGIIGDGGSQEEETEEGLDDTYSRQLKDLPVGEDGGVDLGKTTALTGEIKEGKLPELGNKLNLRFEANIGDTHEAGKGDKVDEWGDEEDLVGIFDKECQDEKQHSHQSNPSNTAWQLPEADSNEMASTVGEQGICDKGSHQNEDMSDRIGARPQFRNNQTMGGRQGESSSGVHNQHLGWSGTGERIPVLSRQMFEEGETPGRDAVYLNSINDGQDQYHDEEMEEEEPEHEKRNDKNPFIDYESRVGSEKSPESIRTPIGNDAWVRGQLTDDNGGNIQPVKLVQPRQTFSSFPPNANGRKRKAPEQVRKEKEELGRIEAYFERKAKLLPLNGGDDIALGGGGAPTLTRLGELPSVQVDFKMDELYSCETTEESEKSVVGRLDEGLWVVVEEGCLALLSSNILREAVLYQSLLSSHILRQERLPEALEVKVSPALEEVALSLATSRCPPGISDKRLVHNGLQVEVRLRLGTAGCCLLLTGTCPDLTLAGHQRQDMVREVLASIGEGCEKLEKCRPSAVREHLMGEATRMAREAPELMRSEVEEMLGFCRQQEIPACPHDQPLLSALWEITSSEA